MSINTTPMPVKLRDVITPVSPYVFYKLYDGTGTDAVDSAGNGPTGTVNGTGTPWANSGWITYNATDDFVAIPWSAYLHSIFDLADMSVGSQIIITYDRYFDGTQDANGCNFWWGNALLGGWGSVNNASEQFETHAAPEDGGGGSYNNKAFTGYNYATASTRHTVTIEVHKKSATLADLYLYVDGVARSSRLDYDMVNGGTLVGTDAIRQQGLVIGTRRTGATAYSWYQEGRASAFLAARLDVRDSALPLKINVEMFQNRGEMPWALDGK